MKFTIGIPAKPTVQEQKKPEILHVEPATTSPLLNAEPEKPKTGLIIGKPKEPATKPIGGLAALQLAKQTKTADPLPKDSQQSVTPAQPKAALSALQSLQKNPKVQSVQNAVAIAQVQQAQKTGTIPNLAPQTEKYVLVAEASEELPLEVLQTFADKMQAIVSGFGTQGLQTALHDILRYTNEHPELRKILREEDNRIFVRAARESYGMTILAKTTNKGKAKERAVKLTSVMEDLANLEIHI